VASPVGLRVISDVRAGDAVALLYDCDVSQPAGTYRLAEFQRLRDGKIQQVRLTFEAPEFRKHQPAAVPVAAGEFATADRDGVDPPRGDWLA
jgi:hypothetical protein